MPVFLAKYAYYYTYIKVSIGDSLTLSYDCGPRRRGAGVVPPFPHNNLGTLPIFGGFPRLRRIHLGSWQLCIGQYTSPYTSVCSYLYKGFHWGFSCPSGSPLGGPAPRRGRRPQRSSAWSAQREMVSAMMRSCSAVHRLRVSLREKIRMSVQEFIDGRRDGKCAVAFRIYMG